MLAIKNETKVNDLFKGLVTDLENTIRTRELNPFMLRPTNSESKGKQTMSIMTELYDAIKSSGLFDEIKNSGNV